MACGVVVED
jgi:hypothetical protein